MEKQDSLQSCGNRSQTSEVKALQAGKIIKTLGKKIEPEDDKYSENHWWDGMGLD